MAKTLHSYPSKLLKGKLQQAIVFLRNREQGQYQKKGHHKNPTANGFSGT